MIYSMSWWQWVSLWMQTWGGGNWLGPWGRMRLHAAVLGCTGKGASHGELVQWGAGSWHPVLGNAAACREPCAVPGQFLSIGLNLSCVQGGHSPVLGAPGSSQRLNPAHGDENLLGDSWVIASLLWLTFSDKMGWVKASQQPCSRFGWIHKARPGWRCWDVPLAATAACREVSSDSSSSQGLVSSQAHRDRTRCTTHALQQGRAPAALTSRGKGWSKSQLLQNLPLSAFCCSCWGMVCTNTVC